MPRGGYQRPSNPAPVSGPGQLSQRTDGGPTQPIRPITGLPYGEGQEAIDQQRQAPLPQAATPGAPTGSSGAIAAAPEPMPLAAGSLMPDQPVTAGADAGPGPDSGALGLPTPGDQYMSLQQYLQNLATTSGNPDIAYLAGMGRT